MSSIPEPLLYWFHALINKPKSVIGTKPNTIPHKRGSIIFGDFLISYTQLLHRGNFL